VYHRHLDSFKASWRQYFFARPTRHDSAHSWLLRLLELRLTNFPTYLLTYLSFWCFLLLVLNKLLTQRHLVSPCRWSVWVRIPGRAEKLVKFNNNCIQTCSTFELHIGQKWTRQKVSGQATYVDPASGSTDPLDPMAPQALPCSHKQQQWQHVFMTGMVNNRCASYRRLC